MNNVEVQYSGESGLFTILVRGKFDFQLINEFRNAYCDRELGNSQVEVDMREVTAIDSSALGMLLSMKHYLNKGNGDIRIANCSDDVMKILRIVRFDKMFVLA